MDAALRAIVWGGATCAALDALAASVQLGLKGIKPLRVWQGVASGLLGERAFRGGWASGGLGLLLHSTIAFTSAALFVEGTHVIPNLARQFWIFGPLFGVAVFLVMTFLVVPLSARPKRPRNLVDTTIQLIIHILFVGLPIAIAANRFERF